MTNIKHSKNDIKYPRYGRGKDPNMDFISYMYNPKLLSVNRSLFEDQVVTPGRKRYERKYEKHLRKKEIKTPEAKERRWRNFDTGVKGRPRMKYPEHLMGYPKSKENIKKVVRKSVNKDKLFLRFNTKEKELFIAVREIYNKLDVENKNSVGFNEILNELALNTKFKDIFSIENPLELEGELNELELEKPEFLTWQELLRLLFKHKPINFESKREIKRKKIPKKQKIKEKKSEQKLPLPRHEFKITVPEPPKFEKREKSKKISIRQQNLIKMLNEEKEEEDRYRNYLIKANPVPITTTQPLYNQIVQEQQRRSEEVKALSREIAEARERPFSFYERDKDLYTKRNIVPNDPLKNIKPFKANPVPDFVLVEMLPEIQRQEEELRELRKQRAYELAKLAHCPLKMYEKREVEVNGMEFTFSPKVGGPVPDFKSEQKEFQRELEKVKQSKILTVPEPFNLSSSGKHKHNCQTTYSTISSFHKTKEEQISAKKEKREQIKKKLEEAKMVLEFKAVKVIK